MRSRRPGIPGTPSEAVARGPFEIYVQEAQALCHLLAGAEAEGRAVVDRLSEGQLEDLAGAALELSELAGSAFDRRLDVRPLTDPEAGLSEILDREGFA